jgi:CRP-like cAMP-binding protein
MLADSLKLAISQRLVKKLCPRCPVEGPLPAEERLVRLGIKPDWLSGVSSVRRGRKCDFCRKTGVSGRKAIFEALILDDEVKIAIQERAPGQRNLGLTAVLRGELKVFQSSDGQELILATPGLRDFLGDVAMLMGTAILFSSRGKAEESEILQVPADRLRQALADSRLECPSVKN